MLGMLTNRSRGPSRPQQNYQRPTCQSFEQKTLFRHEDLTATSHQQTSIPEERFLKARTFEGM
jgi:hypothetical protein